MSHGVPRNETTLPVVEGGDMTKWTISTAMLLAAYTLSAQEGGVTVPKIWDDKALEDWATPIAALGVRPSQFTAAEYYAVPGENLRTYPVYRPDREPPGYWEWLQKQKPQPVVDPANLRNTRRPGQSGRNRVPNDGRKRSAHQRPGEDQALSRS